MLGWLSQHVFGDSLFGLRVLPALEAAAIVVVVAALAREFGALPSIGPDFFTRSRRFCSPCG